MVASPGNAELLCDFGYSCYLQNDLPKAEQYYQAAINVKPDFERAHNNLGQVLARTGRQNDALRHFKYAGCDPTQATANLQLALEINRKLRPQGQQAVAANTQGKGTLPPIIDPKTAYLTGSPVVSQQAGSVAQQTHNTNIEVNTPKSAEPNTSVANRIRNASKNLKTPIAMFKGPSKLMRRKTDSSVSSQMANSKQKGTPSPIQKSITIQPKKPSVATASKSQNLSNQIQTGLADKTTHIPARKTSNNQSSLSPSQLIESVSAQQSRYQPRSGLAEYDPLTSSTNKTKSITTLSQYQANAKTALPIPSTAKHKKNILNQPRSRTSKVINIKPSAPAKVPAVKFEESPEGGVVAHIGDQKPKPKPKKKKIISPVHFLQPPAFDAVSASRIPLTPDQLQTQSSHSTDSLVANTADGPMKPVTIPPRSAPIDARKLPERTVDRQMIDANQNDDGNDEYLLRIDHTRSADPDNYFGTSSNSLVGRQATGYKTDPTKK